MTDRNFISDDKKEYSVDIVFEKADSKTLDTSIYDERIQFIWHNWVCEYAYGNLSREEAIQSFKSDVYYQLGIKSN